MAHMDAGIHQENGFQADLRFADPKQAIADLTGADARRVWCSRPWTTLYYDRAGSVSVCPHLTFRATRPSNRDKAKKCFNMRDIMMLRKKLVLGDVRGTACETCPNALATHGGACGAGANKALRMNRQNPPQSYVDNFEKAQAAYAAGMIDVDYDPLELVGTIGIAQDRLGIFGADADFESALTKESPNQLNWMRALIGQSAATVDVVAWENAGPHALTGAMLGLKELLPALPAGVCLRGRVHAAYLDQLLPLLKAHGGTAMNVQLLVTFGALDGMDKATRHAVEHQNMQALAAFVAAHPHMPKPIMHLLWTARYAPELTRMVRAAQEYGWDFTVEPMLLDKFFVMNTLEHKQMYRDENMLDFAENSAMLASVQLQLKAVQPLITDAMPMAQDAVRYMAQTISYFQAGHIDVQYAENAAQAYFQNGCDISLSGLLGYVKETGLLTEKGWLLIGLTKLTTGNPADARDAFERAMDLNPENAMVWKYLAMAQQAEAHYLLHQAQRQMEKAKATLETLAQTPARDMKMLEVVHKNQRDLKAMHITGLGYKEPS
jgi:tetratricopeptide (TPR) repeat protein